MQQMVEKIHDSNTRQIKPISYATEKTTLALIDDRSLTQALLKNHILSASGAYTVACFKSVDELIEFNQEKPNLINIIMLNIGVERIDSKVFSKDIPEVLKQIPQAPLVLIADHEESCHIIKAIQLGARGYITTALKPSMLISVLNLVLEGGTFAPMEPLLPKIDRNQHTENNIAIKSADDLLNKIYFTPRQFEVWERVKCGESSKVIASKLGMQEGTVKVHLREMMRKLNATNRTQLIYNFEKAIFNINLRSTQRANEPDSLIPSC